MLKYPYSLDKSSKKYPCPKCNEKRFVVYIDNETKQIINENYGKCDRLDGCGCHNVPPKKQYENKSEYNKQYQVKKVDAKPSKVFFFDTELYVKLLDSRRYENNGFINNLLYNIEFPFDSKDVTKVIEMYFLGTICNNGYLDTAITFPFFDINMNLRYVQIRKFNDDNKGIYTSTLSNLLLKDYVSKNKEVPKWLNDYENQDKKMTCLFGEHLLSKFPNAPVFLFESPKTAIISTLFYGLPYSVKDKTTSICLAVGSKGNYTKDRLSVLNNRNVTVFPDLSIEGKTFKEWKDKTITFGFDFKFNDSLEKRDIFQERKEGLDFADFLIRTDWKLLRNDIQKEVIKEIDIQLIKELNPKIEYLERFFNSIDLSKIKSINLGNNAYISGDDIKTFIESHLNIVKTNTDNKTFTPYLDRLIIVKNFITNSIM